MKKSALHTTNERFHDLHILADTKAQTVKVDRTDLMNLLMDHSEMIKLCSDRVEMTKKGDA